MADPLPHERLFYETMWRHWARGKNYPIPWWAQQYFRHWIDQWDQGLFDTKEAAFTSNALYRYWNMVGVKDHPRKSLVGQAGEIEPVYEEYCLAFFLFQPAQRVLHLPQLALDTMGSSLTQSMQDGYLPILTTTFGTNVGLTAKQELFAIPVGLRQREILVGRYTLRRTRADAGEAWLCVAVLAGGPSGFVRHDRAGRYLADKRLSYLNYLTDETRLLVNTSWGPTFDLAPTSYGLYGNPMPTGAAGTPVDDPDFYLANNPFADLAATGVLNGASTATDYLGGMCTAVFAWALPAEAGDTLTIGVRLPVDSFQGGTDLVEIRADSVDTLARANTVFWDAKLNTQGVQMQLSGAAAQMFAQFRHCRSTLLILSDHGAIHPGPTIYNSFWVRDSSVEGIACALAGDTDVAEALFSQYYPTIFNLGNDRIGPASAFGFFGGEHEKTDLEWDSNGEALWAFGRLDRLLGPSAAFGQRMFSPYVLEGARWIRDNRDQYGLLHSGWSAEHLGDKDKPHYWDDLWGLAGLYEAARLAERIGQVAYAQEIGAAFEDLRKATVESIHWVLEQQRAAGEWRTFIPTGPANVGDYKSTMIGAVAYFHPCRLYMGSKLGDDIVDNAFRTTLDSIWTDFVVGGFEHSDAWRAYGPYLTLQLAHAFLLLGHTDRMDALIQWTCEAGFATVSGVSKDAGKWDVVLGNWNEQHCYPIATNFAAVPASWWYMGDIPHGWAAAEFNLLLRDRLFFEADEDGRRTIYLAPGVLADWLDNGQPLSVRNAPTLFGGTFGFQLIHNAGTHTIDIEIQDPAPPDIRFIYSCPFGTAVDGVRVDGAVVALKDSGVVDGPHVALPARFRNASVHYA